MANTRELTLPVLPLSNGVVFPHMVVTLRTETEESRTAVAAAEESDGLLLLVSKLNGTYATVGTVAQIKDSDGGNVVVEGLARARVGVGRTDEQGALWVETEQCPEADVHDEALDDLVGEYRAVVREVLEHYEAQTEDETVAEDEAAAEDPALTLMEVPNELVPKIRELIARRAS